MTYDLTIGKLTVETEELDGEMIAFQGAEVMECPDAPAFPGSLQSRHTNRIMIPWNAYRYFEKALSAVDWDLAELLCRGTNDRAIVPVTPALVAQIAMATGKFRKSHPRAAPEFETGRDANATLARLKILSWWAHYARQAFGDKAVIHIH